MPKTALKVRHPLNAKEQEKRRFFELADRLVRSADAAEQKRLKQELARMTFGE